MGVTGEDDQDRSEAQRHVQRCLAACGLDWNPSSVQRLTGGHGNDSWQFEAHGRRFVLRMPTRRASPSNFSSQLTAHALSASAGILVPPVVATSTGDGVIGRPFLVLGWVEGTDLDALATVEQSGCSEAVRAAGAAVARMHGVRGPCFDHFLLGDGDGHDLAWIDVCRGRLEELFAVDELWSALGQRRTRLVRTTADETLPSAAGCPGPRFTHGDLYFSNLVVTPTGEIAVIDLEHARHYDSLWDFVKLDSWSFRSHPQLVDDFMAGYVGAGGQDPRDCERYRLYQLIEYVHALGYFLVRYPDEEMAEHFLGLLDRCLGGARGFVGATETEI